MKSVISIILLLLSTAATSLFSQGCLPEGIFFSSQSQVDNFQTNYPACTEIEGNVNIEGPDILNLSGLSVLTSIGGSLMITNCENLDNLSGLENLEYVGSNFAIGENVSLINLTGLESLAEISGNVWIFDNDNLTNLSGIGALTTIGETISFYYNQNLSDITALISLSTIGDAIFLDNNDKLESLAGLDNIAPNSILNLLITNNDLLSDCNVESVCAYLVNPTGILDIYGNAIGCGSQQEVEDACNANSVEELIFSNNISIFPNPADNILTIKANSSNDIEEVSLYNNFYEKVYQGFLLDNIIDISSFLPGMYILEVKFSELVVRKKLMIK